MLAVSNSLQWARAHNCSGVLRELWQSGADPSRLRPAHRVRCEPHASTSGGAPTSESAVVQELVVAVNPYHAGKQRRHHDVFSHFRPWRGSWPSDGGLVDFMGFRVDDVRGTYCNWACAQAV